MPARSGGPTLPAMAQLGPLLSPLLVGRDDLLDLAERRIAEAAHGRGQLILLAGEAGIGKTRLMRSIHRKAEAAGFRIAQGDLSPQDRLVPLASILDLARTMRASAGFGTLGEAVLELRRRDGGDTLGARRMLVRDIADAIAADIERPTLLAFEDLQWADEVSLEVIGELARLVRDRPVLLIGSYRIDELPVDSVHREWRARLLSQRLAEEARLAPLTYEQTALVTTLILDTGLPAPREVVSAVYERTDGIPLHIEELLGALGDAARADGRAIRNANVPETIEDAILARGLADVRDAQAVARAGAVIGRCFVPDVLAGIMDCPLADLDAALDELVANSVLFPFQFVDRATSTSAISCSATSYTRASRPTSCASSTRGPRSSGQSRRPHRDPRLGPLRAGRPAGRGVPHRAGRCRSRDGDVEPQRGVRAVSTSDRQRPRRPAPDGAGRALRGVLRGRVRGR